MRFWYDMAKVAAAAIRGDLKLMVGDPATPDTAFYADAADLAGLFKYDLKSLALVTPTAFPTWTLYKTDGATAYNPTDLAYINLVNDAGTFYARSTNKALIVDRGVKANLSAYFRYPAPNSSQALPTSVSGSFGISLPGPDTNSSPALFDGPVTADKAYSVTLAKAKSGLIVVSNQVQEPSGFDTTADNFNIKFQGRGNIGYFTDAAVTAAQIQSVVNAASFQTSRARTFNNVTASGGRYLYYFIPADLGVPTSVLKNGAQPIRDAFTILANVNIVNQAGATIAYTVMRSFDTDAFNNSTLAFS